MNNLKYVKFEETMVDALVELWNRDVYGTEIYAEFSKL